MLINTAGVVGFSVLIAFCRVTVLELAKGVYKTQEKLFFTWWNRGKSLGEDQKLEEGCGEPKQAEKVDDRGQSSSEGSGSSTGQVEENAEIKGGGKKEQEAEEEQEEEVETKRYEAAIVELVAEKSLDFRSEVTDGLLSDSPKS